MDRDRLKQQLIRDEGKRRFPYTDTTGHLTIGVGRNLSQVGLSEEEIEYLLEGDISRAINAINGHGIDLTALNDPRQAVLVNMAFNLGITGLLSFQQTLKWIKAGNYAVAAHHMHASQWAHQVGDRAERLATQLETGDWQ